MCATAAHLTDRVVPAVALRQWVITFPFPWRYRRAQDGTLLSALTRIFVDTSFGTPRPSKEHGARLTPQVGSILGEALAAKTASHAPRPSARRA